MLTMLPNKRIFIFDLDGTLVDAYRAIRASLNFTLEKFDYKKVSLDIVKKSVGKGDRSFIKKFFKEIDLDKAIKIYGLHHKKSLMTLSKCLPYTKSLLKQLKIRKKAVVVVTNRPDKFSRIILKNLDINKYIDYVFCADITKKRKPDPGMLEMAIKKFNFKRKDAVYVGDMAIDLEAAKRAKIDSIFIKGGSGTLREAKRFKNTKIISSLKEVLSIYG